ncbi:MAG: hypothetical protein AAGA70_06145 [Pseudomonadota bacterium]
MSDPQRRSGRTTFLERKTYRRARLEDAARLLPVLGLCLFFGPVAIQSTAVGMAGGTGQWLVFFLLVWLLLIGLAAMMSRALLRSGRKD